MNGSFSPLACTDRVVVTLAMLTIAGAAHAQTPATTPPPIDGVPSSSATATPFSEPVPSNAESQPPTDDPDLATESDPALSYDLNRAQLTTNLDVVTPVVATTYLPSRLPWEPAEVPDVPEWRAQGGRMFQNPALGTSAIGGVEGPSGGSGLQSLRDSNPLRVGPFDIFPALGYRATYATGLRSGSNTEDTWVHSFTPRISLLAGDHWRISYAPSIRFYSDDEFNSSVNHSVFLSGWASYDNWTYRLNHRTAINDDPLVETGRQTKNNSHSTSLGASLDRGLRGAYDFSLTQNLRLTDQENDMFSWMVQTAYSRPLTERLRAGLIASVGYDLPDEGSEMMNQRLSAFISGPLGNKLSYNLTAGVSFRQFLDTSADTSVSPLASLNLTYQLLQRTSLGVGISHDNSTSLFTDQYTENTSAQGWIRQEISDRWSLSINGGYRMVSYRTTFASNPTVREDNVGFVGASINGRLTQRISTTLAYDFTSNDSDEANRSFDSHQISLGLNWAL